MGWRIVSGLGMVNGWGSYEVKVSCEEMVSYVVKGSYGVIGEGSFEESSEGCCEGVDGHFWVKVEVDHSVEVVEVDHFVEEVEVECPEVGEFGSG